jgi:hypothetical protein
MDDPELRIPLEMAEHLIRQLQNAARETGWESLILRTGSRLRQVWG